MSGFRDLRQRIGIQEKTKKEQKETLDVRERNEKKKGEKK
jgi:hypothetical protein